MSEKHNDLDPNSVVSYLEKHWNDAAVIYLEYLINDLKTEVGYLTMLILLLDFFFFFFFIFKFYKKI